MTAKVIQIRDFQNKRDMERLYAEFSKDCSLATSIALIPHDREIDTAPSEITVSDDTKWLLDAMFGVTPSKDAG